MWSRGSLTIEVEFISNFLMNKAWSRGIYSISLVNSTKVVRLVTKGGEGETWRESHRVANKWVAKVAKVLVSEFD